MALPDIVTKLHELGVEPRASSPEDLAQAIADSTSPWAAMIKDRNIRLQQ